MDWEDRLDDWELELELTAKLDGSQWVTLERAVAETGVSRAALRTWYRTGQIASRLVDAARAEASPRLRKTAERRLGDEAQLEILRHRVDQLELRIAHLESHLGKDLVNERWRGLTESGPAAKRAELRVLRGGALEREPRGNPSYLWTSSGRDSCEKVPVKPVAGGLSTVGAAASARRTWGRPASAG